jgi:hypothetical protein
MGLEPTTDGTTIRNSAIELHPPHIEKYSMNFMENLGGFSRN